MQKLMQIVMVLLLSSPIWVLLSACSPGGEPPSVPTGPIEETTGTSAATTAQPLVEEQEPGEDQKATTVFAAAQIIDLSGLPLPTEIKAMRRSEVGYKSFELWDDVASVIGLYQPTFIEQGWQNDAEYAYTDETTDNRYFRKDGFVVSMSVSSLGEITIVSFINHGNIHLGTLPQTRDAQPLYQFPNRLVYGSPSRVQDVANFTRQALAAQGWHEYTKPDAATANDGDSQNLTFIQNGLELSAFISAPPDQGDETAVQYSITLLPLDLPVYEDALDLVFGRIPPYLGYRTAAGIGTLTDFYRTEMSTLGWAEMPETASITPEQAALYFVGQKLFANDRAERTVMLELASVDDQTQVTLRQVDASEIRP